MLFLRLRAPAVLAVLAVSTGCIGLNPRARPRPSYVAQSVTIGSATNLALTPAVVFQDGTGSLSYHAPTYADLPARVEVRDVQGRACESGLQVPWGVLTQPSTPWLDGLSASIGWGDSGYQRALRDAANQVAPDALLYDVRADLQTVNVLSIWRQACIVVTASAVTRLPDDDAPLTSPAASSETAETRPTRADVGAGAAAPTHGTQNQAGAGAKSARTFVPPAGGAPPTGVPVTPPLAPVAPPPADPKAR